MEMDNKCIGIIFLLVATAASKSISIDYDSIEVNGNDINDNVLHPHDYYGDIDNELAIKKSPEIYHNDKRNILSALRAKMRRSNKPVAEDIEEKFKFAPVLSVDALNNLNGFFDNLASNIHTMESRNLLPNQMRLLGESEYRPSPRDPYGHSAALINSIRSYTPSKSIRKLLSYQPGAYHHSHPLITNQVNRKERS